MYYLAGEVILFTSILPPLVNNNPNKLIPGKRKCDSDKQLKVKISPQPHSLFSPPSYSFPLITSKQVLR